MKSRSSGHNGADPTFVAWLRKNPTGIPRRHAVRVAAAGAILGLLGGVVASVLDGTWHMLSRWALGLSIAGGVLGGATLGAVAVVLLARLLDTRLWPGDSSIGYSGVIRMLLHAGELSFLGGISGGIGGGLGGFLAGMIGGGLIGGAIGAILYRVRGLGPGLGMPVGVVTGAVGGAVGAILALVGS